MKVRLYLAFLFIVALQLVYGQTVAKTFLFVGSYTGGEVSEGIYVYEFDSNTGEVTEVEREGNLINPSFITISPNGQYLYACTESKLERHGSVSAFVIDTLSGKLYFMNKQDTGGRNPVHAIVDNSGKYLVSSNYTDSGISIYQLQSDGSISPASQSLAFQGSSIVPQRQDASHLHSANFSPDNRYLLAPDLGSDKIRVFSFHQATLLASDSLSTATKAGSGPRHFTFHPNGKLAYCVEELSGTVTAYRYQNGQLSWLATDFSYSKQQAIHGAADIHISPDGKFLYASNRGDDNTIAIFSIQPGGALSLIGHQTTYGDHPRSFVIDPSGRFLIVANQVSHQIVVFKRDLATGLLTKTDTEIRVDSPSSLKMKTYGNY